MDEAHFLAAVRYLAFNPVRAKLATRPQDWPWSNVRAHLAGRDDGLVRVRPLLDLAPSPQELFTMSLDESSALFAIETKSMTGRPLGNAEFIAAVEHKLGYTVTPGKRGPKARTTGKR